MNERSARSDSASDCAGNSVSPSAATAPLAPATSSATHPVTRGAMPRRFAANGKPTVSHQAVNVSAASSRNVFSRCAATNIARAIVALSATSWNSTSPAPIAASLRISTPDITAPARAGCPARQVRNVATRSATTASSARPLVARCENSIKVATPAARGTTSPLQSGQWAPQPAPEPVARTYAPHRMTATL